MKITKSLLALYLFIFSFSSGYTQILEINNATAAESTFSLQQLVEDVLIDSDCANVDTFSEQVSGQPADTQTKSYGYFKKPAGSNFPFDEGVVLTTGRAFPAGNTNNNINDNPSFSNGLAGDADLEAALGINNTNDATYIKFNFVPTSDDFNFRFLMASEEYDGATECDFADSFAFLLREVGTANYINLAVLPNGTAVSVTNINNSNACRANTDFFEGYDLGSTNYGGRTKVLTASATVVPNLTYEIKIVVADQGDFIWDSAIFLEAGSFNIGLDLGEDLTLSSGNPACNGDTIILDTQIPTSVATHTWYLDGNLINGETNSTLGAATAGDYSVIVEYASNCSSTDSISIEFTENPNANPVSNQLKCDDNNDGFWNFDFDPLESTVLGSQDASNFTVSFHSSQVDADNDANAITSPYTNQNAYQSETIYVRIESNINPNCNDTSESFEIDVFDTPSTSAILFDKCDNIDDGDDTNGFVEFDLNTLANQVLGTQNATQFNISYHFDQTDANMNASPLPLLYTNTTINAQDIIVRLENVDNPLCYTTATVMLVVNPLPIVNPIISLRQCDDDTDGLTIFNLTEANVLISNNSANEFFTYYLTEAQAETGLVANQITNFTTYQNPTALNSVVYSRVETAEGCSRTARINLIVGVTQIPSTFHLDYSVCDDSSIDNDNTNGVAAFNFSDATAQFIALFPAGQNISLTYYTNLADALSETNSIPDIANHRNDVSPNVQDIYVRIDSDDVNACLGLGHHITLTVNTLPEQNMISDYPECSDTNSATFDLNIKNAEVIGSQTVPLLITYHESLNEAINNQNPITSPYINNQSPRTIYVRSQFDDNNNGVGDSDECFTTDMTFDLIINPNPIVFTPTPIRICNDQVATEYDLMVREDEITNSDNTIALTYFESQQDLNNNNPIINPTQYVSTQLDQDISVLATGANGCTSQITLSLKTILYANLNENPQSIEECEIDNDGFDRFDITRREIQILNGLNDTDFTFTYYEMEQDAIDGNTNTITNPLDFTNSIEDTQIIYVRVLPVANECFIVIPITLIVNPVPEIDIEPYYVICLSSNNQVINAVDQTVYPNPPIDTQLSDTEYTFEWFQGEDVVAANIINGATQSSYAPTAPGFYTVNATNILTGCTIPGTTEVFASYPPESITVDVTSLSFDGNNVLEVTVVGNGNYQFSLDHGAWQTSSTFQNVIGGERVVRVRDTYNCEELIYELVVIDYPKFFTPNNDGYNDSWNIYGLNKQLDAKIYIYDRYGKLLKQLKPDNDGWDGTFNGVPLAADDYWFTVEFKEPLNNTKKLFKAHFTLKH